MLARYEILISCSSKVIAKIDVDKRHKRADGTKTVSPQSSLRRYIITCPSFHHTFTFCEQTRDFCSSYMFIMKGGCTIFIPPATKLGGYTGIAMSVCPSVRLSSAFGFPAHNCFPFTLIIMKLHMQTPHETRMCPIDFEVQRSMSQYINY